MKRRTDRVRKYILTAVLIVVIGSSSVGSASTFCPPSWCCPVSVTYYDLPDGTIGMIGTLTCGWMWVVVNPDGTGSVFACPNSGLCTYVPF